MRVYAWVAAGLVQVLSGCGEIAGGSGEDAPAADAADAALDRTYCTATMAYLQHAIAALAASRQGCQQDADCTTVSTSTACRGACGIGLNVNFAGDYAAGLAALDDKFCKQTNYTASCGYATPKCIAPAPGCVNNQCVYKK